MIFNHNGETRRVSESLTIERKEHSGILFLYNQQIG